MGRYHLLMDYLVPIYTNFDGASSAEIGPLAGGITERTEYYRKGLLSPLPKTKRILEVESGLVLYVAFFDVDVGHFVIGSRSLKKAYDLANLIRALFSLYLGWQPDERGGHYFLQELRRLPQPSWDDRRVSAELETDDLLLIGDRIPELRMGYLVSSEAFAQLPAFIAAIAGKEYLIEALQHMLESRFLFCGFMTGSYYECHYSHERRSTRPQEMEKRYFEHRLRYETAFLAAFKGIERFFAVNDIKEPNISSMIQRCRYLGIEPESKYTRYHEIFSGHEREATYRDMIAHFLRLRNIVAAHGNKNPPASVRVFEDSVYEIQLFLLELLSKAIWPRKSDMRDCDFVR